MSLKNVSPTKTLAWKALLSHFDSIKGSQIKNLLNNKNRIKDFTISNGDFLIDFSKNIINKETIELLLKLAEECDLENSINKQFEGDKINKSENRAVLHTAVRSSKKNKIYVDGENIIPEIKKTREKIKEFTNDILLGKIRGVTDKKITDIVNIGIGGSDLGPNMVIDALKFYRSKLNPHFISNIDGDHVYEVLEKLDSETTLFIVVSKTFTTQETISNAKVVKEWLTSKLGPNSVKDHFAAVSSNIVEVEKFGIRKNYIFPMNDWVGGRFSVWSSVGLSVSLSIGFKNFEEFLNGAEIMDKHFQSSPLKNNMPVILGLISIWYNNFFKCETEAIIPYSEYLKKLPPYLQQAIMESNGKSVDRNGKKIKYQTGNIIWGNTGTNAQHAFFQLIHQGTKIIPCDFIGFKKALNKKNKQHDKLMSNFFAQSKALMMGKKLKQVEEERKNNHKDFDTNPFRVFEGNKPSNTILIDKLTPSSLGSLIALFEHKIFVQGVIWNIFSYDQWGVELGKDLANNIHYQLNQNKIEKHDKSTEFLIKKYLKK